MTFASWLRPSSIARPVSCAASGVVPSGNPPPPGVAATPSPTLLADPHHADTVYAGTPAGCSRRTTAAATGARVPLRAPASVLSLAIDPQSGAVYAGTRDGVIRSSDAGRSWTGVLGSVTERLSAMTLAVAHAPPGTLYAGVWPGDVLKSTDGGDRWTSANHGFVATGVHALAVDPQDPRLVYASVSGTGVFRSSDRGRSWLPVTQA